MRILNITGFPICGLIMRKFQLAVRRVNRAMKIVFTLNQKIVFIVFELILIVFLASFLRFANQH